MRIPSLVALGAAVLVAACGGGDADTARSEPSAADTVAAAMAQYEPAAFDSISWETPDDALVRGSVVYAYSCQKCHGRYGEGDGNFVTQGDTLRPPDFTVADWRFIGDLEGLREQVYIGTTEGMPHWGLEGLKYRDIDAVARFLQDGLNRS